MGRLGHVPPPPLNRAVAMTAVRAAPTPLRLPNRGIVTERTIEMSQRQPAQQLVRIRPNGEETPSPFGVLFSGMQSAQKLGARSQ